MDDLASVDLLDCGGRTTHTLTLLPDGTVEVLIRSSGARVRVDPARKLVLTPGISLHEDLLHAAGTLRPW